MIDANNFRRLCGRFATGVTIVTAIDAEGFQLWRLRDKTQAQV